MNTIGNVATVATMNIQSMDLETAMLTVQTNRANLLETQLKDQITAVQAKNDQIAKLNQMLGVMNKIAAGVSGSATASTAVSFTAAQSAELEAAAKEAGITLAPELSSSPQSWEVKLRDGTKITVDAAGKAEAEDYKSKNWAFRSSDYSGKKGITSITENPAKLPAPNKGQLDGAIQQLKSQIDASSNSQQMDMLRLQSLSNKRNEAFETMTNFIKKMQDSRNSIIGNMR